ncbi:nuclear transport factor 2 family protein [Streptomyces sp. NPDC007084]|uniref:nuclear transport factor 2 family protein n=1 Tax=Streptomyces sp. NPDC007084 TaxID=3154313 RepID=UPI0034536995
MTLDEKINALWDEKQVEKSILRAGHALDTDDWATFRSCFTETVLADFRRATGLDEVVVDVDLWVKWAKDILGQVQRRHVYTNWHITVDGDRAHARVYLTAEHFKSTDRGAPYNTQHGWEDFWLERQEDDTWLTARVKHDFMWIDGNFGLMDLSSPAVLEMMGQVFREENFEAARLALAAY